jgi:hypothetical protein
MVTLHQPKKLSFVPPILKRKFVMPEDPRELGTLIIIVGLSISLITSGPTAADLLAQHNAQEAKGKLVATSPFRAGIKQRMVGVYIFEDEAQVPASVRGSRVYLKAEAVPKTATIVWKRGRPQTAQVIYAYFDYLLGLPIGLATIAMGLWIARKKKAHRS